MKASGLRQLADADGLFEKPVYGLPLGQWCGGLHEALLLIEDGTLPIVGGDPTDEEEVAIHRALAKPPVSDVLHAVAQLVAHRIMSPADAALTFAGWAAWYETCTVVALIELRRRYGGS
jgi:hypothetical protein